MQSHPLLEALKRKLRARIRYFCQVTHVGIEDSPFEDVVILCLSEHSMFILDKEMNEKLGEVFYAHILRVVNQKETSGPQDVLRLEISDDRPKGIPAKFTLISSEKSNLLMHLRCYWETDYMWRLAKIGYLRIDKEPISLKKFRLKKKEANSKEVYLYPPNKDKTHYLKGYGFFAPNFLNQNKQVVGEYQGEDKSGQHYKLSVLVEDLKQVEVLQSDLKSKCETLVERFLKQNQDYYYLRNNPYLKKMNLNNDIASWKGWEVLLVTSSEYISLIVMRRKFIPPMVDCGQDILFICSGGPKARSVVIEPADSVFSTATNNEVYRDILSHKCEALIMNEETASFFQYQLNITPKRVCFAYQFILSVMKIISRASSDSLQNLIKELEKKPEAQVASVTPEMSEFPVEVLKCFESDTSADKGSIEYRKWGEKVRRYLAYCLDGGLLQSRFTLEDMIGPVMKGIFGDIASLNKIKLAIKELLNLRQIIPDEEEKVPEDIYSLVDKMLEDSGFLKGNSYIYRSNWTFNEKVMIALIETGYLQRELEFSGNMNAYPTLLRYLLEKKDSSFELKGAVCRVTVGIKEQSDLQVLKPLIPHLLNVYTGPNYALATQAAISLINFAYNNRENKQLLYQERQKFISKLEVRNYKLLAYTLLLIKNLASDSSKRRVFSKEILSQLLEILRGPSITEAKPSEEVLSRGFQLLLVLCKDHSVVQHLVTQKDFLQAVLNYLGSSAETEAFSFLAEFLNKSQEARNYLGDNAIGLIVNRLKESYSTPVLKTLKVICSFNPENLRTLQIENGEQLLEQLARSESIDAEGSVLVGELLGFIKNS